MRDALLELISKWECVAKTHAQKSADTWLKLRDDDLPQDDAIIYSVYEDQATATAYHECAAALKALVEQQDAE